MPINMCEYKNIGTAKVSSDCKKVPQKHFANLPDRKPASVWPYPHLWSPVLEDDVIGVLSKPTNVKRYDGNVKTGEGFFSTKAG